MEVLFLLSLVIQILSLSQDKAAVSPTLDLELLRFSWSHYRGGMVVSDRKEKGSPASRQRVYRQEIENRSSIENRSRDMKELEDSVYNSAPEAEYEDIYKYVVELRNHGAKVIKWVFWDYQSSDPSHPDDISHRQFACAVKIKPDATEPLNGFSALPPRGVVNVDKEIKAPVERVYINRVEYADGESWQRPDWVMPSVLPSRSNGRGKCRPI
jgi:hypothetical protein